MSFGSINPLDGNAYTSTSSITVTCPAPTTFDAWISAGSSGDTSQRLMMSGANALKYNLYQDPGHSDIWEDNAIGGWQGSADEAGTTATVYGRVPHQPTAYPGTYSDALVVTVSF